MKKILKLEIVGGDSDNVFVKIAEQSHTRNDFGNNADGTMFMWGERKEVGSSLGSTTGSHYEAQPKFIRWTSGWWYLQCLPDTRVGGDTKIKIPVKYIGEVMSAVQAYNDFEYKPTYKFPIYFAPIEDEQSGWVGVAYVVFQDEKSYDVFSKSGKVANMHNLLDDAEFRMYITNTNGIKCKEVSGAVAKRRVEKKIKMFKMGARITINNNPYILAHVTDMKINLIDLVTGSRWTYDSRLPDYDLSQNRQISEKVLIDMIGSGYKVEYVSGMSEVTL